MTKDEWKRVDEALAGMFGTVGLFVDGHEVDLHKKQIGKNKLGIMTYVDGWYKGKWTEEDPEIKYLRLVEKFVFSAKDKRDMQKIYGKRMWKKEKVRYDKKYTYFSPLWLSVSGIRRHYEKTFKSIELVKINGEDASPSATEGLNGQ